jgi:TetR/AcrR family transcriptional regulator
VTTATFQRARKPEEINIRREAILAAAADLFDREGPEGAGLNAIAVKAGFTKSNVYRYFESREAVLLSLFQSEFVRFVETIEASLGAVPPGDLDAVARLVATALLERPRLGQLMCILSSVLERNVSAESVVALKRSMLGLSQRLAAALARALPALSVDDCAWAGSTIGTYVAGMWPAAFPNPVVADVIARPEFDALRAVPERDLERTILVLLKGLYAPHAAPRQPAIAT